MIALIRIQLARKYTSQLKFTDSRRYKYKITKTIIKKKRWKGRPIKEA